MGGWLVRGCGLTAVALVLTACVSSATPPTPPTPAVSHNLGTGPAVFALLADGRLLVASPVDAAISREVRLARSARGAGEPDFAHVLALDARRRVLHVLLDVAGAGGVVVTVDARTLVVRGTWALPAGIRHRSLAVGPASGAILVFGDRAEAGGRSPWLTRLSVAGAVVGSWRLRPADGRDWRPYAAAVSADERFSVVSYHGERTTGADIVGLDGPERRPCRQPVPAGAGCLAEVHGSVAVSGGRVLATTGDGGFLVSVDPVRLDHRRLDVGLSGNHLMEFAVDPAGSVHALGSCRYAGGLSRLRADGSAPHVLSVPSPAPQRPHLCGERLSAGPAGLVAIARGPVSAGSSSLPAGIDLLDGDTGRVIGTVSTPAAVVDVVVG